MEKDSGILSANGRRAWSRLARLAVLPIVAALVLGPAISAQALAPAAATICLLSSTGAPTPGATAEYYAGSWRFVGTTGADGCVSTADAAAAANTYFRVSLAGQSQTVTQNTTVTPVVTFRTIATTVRFLDSSGTGLPGGTAEYYAGTWRPFGTTDADGTTTRELLTGSTYFRIASGGQSQTLTHNPGTNPIVTFRTIATTARFVDSTNAPVAGASIEYYAGTWRPFGTTDANGTTTRELLTGSTYFRGTSGGQTQQLTQNPGTDPLVTFRTVATVVRLLDSTGAGVSGATVEYYAGTWKAFGTTDATGATSRQLITGSTYFRVVHGGQSQQIAQNTNTDPVVTFRTIATTARFTNSLGAGIAGAPVEYYAGTWRSFGTTDATGAVTRELLSGSTFFRISHLGLSQQVSQNPGSNPVLNFQTGRVLQGVGTAATQWYGSGWKAFASGLEILPGSTTFRLADGRTHVASVVAGSVTYVPAAPTAPVVDAGGDLTVVEGGTVALGPAVFTDLEAGARHTATILWGDGSAAEAGVITQVDGLAGTITGSHVYADNGTYSVRVCVTDDIGPTAQGCAELTVTVTNAAPTLALPPVTTPVEEGALVTIEASATSPGTADDLTATWTVTHDDAAVAAGEGLSPTFTPVDDGTYRVTVTVQDSDGGSATAETSVTVSNVAPTVHLPESKDEVADGSTVVLAATVTDPGADDVQTIWSVTLDGAPFTSGTGPDVSFVPEDEGDYRVRLIADDGDGGRVVAGAFLTIAAPTTPVLTGQLGGGAAPMSATANAPTRHSPPASSSSAATGHAGRGAQPARDEVEAAETSDDDVSEGVAPDAAADATSASADVVETGLADSVVVETALGDVVESELEAPASTHRPVLGAAPSTGDARDGGIPMLAWLLAPLLALLFGTGVQRVRVRAR